MIKELLWYGNLKTFEKNQLLFEKNQLLGDNGK